MKGIRNLIKRADPRLLGLLLSSAGAGASFLVGFLSERGLFDPRLIPRVLSGNFGLDALMEFLLSGVLLLPAAVVFALISRRWQPQSKLWQMILSFLAGAYILLTLVYIVSQFTVPLLPFLFNDSYEYVRGSVGLGFLAAVFSLISYRWSTHRRFRLLLVVGICLPILLCGLIPWSLGHNQISWRHFLD